MSLLLCNFKQWYKLDQQVDSCSTKTKLIEQLTHIHHDKWQAQVSRLFGVNRPNTAVQQSPENTEKLHFKKQILVGNESVIGRKNDSIIKSEGFKIINKENKVIFFGKSYLTLNK